MKKIALLFLFIAPLCFGQQETKIVRGMVTDGRNPIEDVNISIADKGTNTFSDASGRYSIEAEVGDIISYSYQGLKSAEIMVEDVTRILNPVLVPDVNQLEEVIVLGSNRKSQKELALEYKLNKRLIRTAYGYLDADTAPGLIRFLDESQINNVALCILDVLRAEFPGVRVVGNCTGAFGQSVGGQLTNITGQVGSGEIALPGTLVNASGPNSSATGKVFVRGTNSITNPRSAVFDIDGQIFTDAPIWIDVRNIKRMAVLNNFATTTMYGSIGAGGVVVVNTITGNPKSNKITDYARLRNNYVAGKILTQEEISKNAPRYLRELQDAPSKAEALSVYDKNKSIYSSSPFFVLDAYRMFTDIWKDTKLADSMIEANAYLFQKNAVLLKALGYLYQEQGRTQKALEVYKEVMKLRPNYAQSYVDMANAYRDVNNAKQAAAMYTRFQYMIDQDLIEPDTTVFMPLFEREYNNLLFLNKNAVVDSQKASSLYVAEEDFQGTRLVFEWNDSETEFELQFVNPGDQYY
ncbi:MAG: carboxypeptidase-like regulatory domain-containing protein, partial [Eudoraea sp.]|nr:carboxypeptidase-like regulatory domain-containing protein [Eudoraea sp.]